MDIHKSTEKFMVKYFDSFFKLRRLGIANVLCLWLRSDEISMPHPSILYCVNNVSYSKCSAMQI